MVEQSRIKKAYYNIICLSLYQMILLGCNLILPRLIIYKYGSAYNGIISSVTQFLGFISILRLGISGTVRVLLYDSLAKKDIKKTNIIISTTQNYMRRVSYILVAYVLVLASIYPVVIVQGFSKSDIFLLVIAIGIGSFGEYYFGLTYQTLLDADQRMYVYNALMTITLLLNTLITSVLIIKGYTIVLVKIISGIIMLVNPVLLSFIVKRTYCIDATVKPDMKLLNKRKDAMGHSIANIVNENTDMIVLSLFCDIKVVSVYMVYNLIMGGLVRLLNIFTSGSEAVLGNMWAKKEMDLLRKNFLLFEYLISMFVIIIFSTTLILILPFVNLYTKNVSDIAYIVPVYAFLIVLAKSVYCFRIPYLALVQAIGHYKETKMGAYFEAVINILISVILVKKLGLIGTVVGTLIATSIRTIQYILYVYKKVLNENINRCIKLVIWLISNMAFIVVLCEQIKRNYLCNSWIAWLMLAMLVFLIACIICTISCFLFYRKIFFSILEMAKKGIKR